MKSFQFSILAIAGNVPTTSGARHFRSALGILLALASTSAALGQSTLTNIISGSISVPGERDQFTFTVAADSRFYFDSLTNVSTVQWSLSGPAGVQVANLPFTASDSQNTGDPTLLLRAGDYTLTIEGPNAATAGYAFRFVNLAEATLLIPGTIVTNTLVPANKTDFYQFNASAGDRFYFQRVTKTGMPNAYWRLIDPYDNQVFSQSFIDAGTPSAPITLPATGTYTVLLEGYIGDTGSGSYAFNVVPEGHVTPPVLTGTPVNIGDLIAGTLAANTTNSYIFTVAATTRATLDSQTNSPGMTWALQGPSGLVVSQRAINSSDSYFNAAPLNLPAGDYQLRVSGTVNAPYAFRLLDLSQAIPFTSGITVTNVLNPANSTRMFQFTPATPGKYYFNYVSESGVPSAQWRLISPYNNTVFYTSLTTDQGPITLTESGTYVLLIDGYLLDTGAGTNVFVALPVSDGLQALTVGSVVNGAISSPGQHQQYTFALSSQTRLYFDTQTNSPQLRWFLDGPTGNVVNNLGFGTDLMPNSLMPGNYTLTVSAANNSDATAAYQFRFLDLSLAPALVPGVPVNDTLNPASSAKAYQLNISSPGRYFFDSQISSGLPNASWQLIHPLGAQVFNVGLGGDQGPLNLVAGTYTLLVAGYVLEPNSGSFGFTVQPVNDESQAMSLGSVVTGSIDSPGQHQQYSFALASPSHLYFDALTNLFQFRWSLDGPTGNVVSSLGLNADYNAGLLPAGNYTLTVFANNNSDAAGNYQFRMFDLSSATPLTPGSLLSDTLNPANSTKAYRFTVTTAGKYFFDFRSSTGMPTASWQLLDPRGASVFSLGLTSDGGPYTLLPGSYTLLVQGYLFDPGNGSFTVVVVPVTDGLQALTPGNTVTGAITTPGQQQQYTFSLGSEAMLYFDSQTNSPQLRWSLQGPVGNLVANRSFTSSDGQSIGTPVVSASPGAYTLTISAIGDFTGGYRFRLFDLASATVLTPGTPVAGPLNPANATVAYKFDASAGDRFFFDYQSSSGIPNAYWRLVDPFASIIFGRSFNTDAGTNALTATGTYFVLIEGSVSDTGSGNYGFNVQPAGNVPPSLTGTPLTLGTLTTGTLATSTDTNRFVFSLAAPGRLYFDSLTNAAFQWSLIGPPGLVVNNRSFQSSDSIDIADPLLDLPAGDYQLNVKGPAGGYQFQLLNFTNTTVLTPGTPVSGALAPADSTVFYQFSGNTGDRFYFDGQTASGFSYIPNCRIYGPLGNIVQSTYVSSDLDTFTLPQTGTYTLTVEGRVYDTHTNGTYSFNLVPVNYPTNSIAVGSTVNGTIQLLGQRNVYTLTLPSAATLYFDSLTNANFNWRLDAPWGQVVDWRSFTGSDSQDVLNPALSLQAGDYTLTVADAGFNGIGDYQFRLLNFSNATMIVPGTPVNGTLAPANATVFYQFNGNAGDHYYFDGQPATGFGYAPYCRLYSPQGTIVQSTYVSSDLDTFTLPQTGTYTLTVEGRVFDTHTNGAYSFNFVAESYPTNAIAVGSTINGTIPVSGQRNIHPFTLASKATLYFDALTNGNFSWRLDAPWGEIVDWRSFSASDGAEIANPALPLMAGDYTLTVASSGFAGTGDYQFRLLDFTNATAFAPGTPVNGSLAPANGTVFYQFAGNSGDRYYFDGQSPTGFTYVPYCRLYGPLGNIVQSTFVNGDLDTFALPQTGVYTFTVEGRVFDTHTNGNFTFNLVPNPVQAPQPIFTTNVTPDLVVANITVTAPGGLQSGGTATVQWTDNNSGNGPTGGSFTDRVTIRNTSSLVLVDALLPYTESDPGNGPIGAGGGRNRQLLVRLPDGTNSVGTLQVTVTTDTQNAISESSEANNSAGISVSASLAPYPDLAVDSISASPPTGWLPGSVVTVNWRLTNSGVGIAATNWVDSIVVRNTNTSQVIFSGSKNYNLPDPGNGPVTGGDFRNRSQAFTTPTDANAYGGFAITVTADNGNQVFEYNVAGTAELNNAATTTIVSAPDLVPTGLAVSPPSGSIHSGDTITISWNDQNNGNVDTGSGFSDHVVVVNADTSERLMDTTVFYNPAAPGNGPIAPGASRPRSTTLLLPNGPRGVGTLQVTVSVDSFNQLPEVSVTAAAENNNSASTSVVSAIAAYPDLQIAGLTIQPATLASGTNVTIQWQDTNSGNVSVTANWYDRVLVLNTNTGATLLDTTLIHNTGSLGPLTNGTARSRSFSFTLPNGPDAVGQLRFTIAADYFNSVFEYNAGSTGESNNTASVVVGSSIAPYPDLEIVNLDVLPATLASGTNLTIHWQDANTGNAPTLGSWYDRVVIANTDAGVTLLDTNVVYDATTLGVLTNATVRDRSVSFQLPITTNGAGNLRFSVTADTLNNLFEYNPGGTGESNNSNSVTRISNLTPLPDLVVTSISAPTNALTDHAINVQFNVANQGLLAADGNISQRVFISTTPTPGSGTLAAVTAFNGPINAGQGTNQSVTLQTPSIPGTYWLIVQTDGSDNVQELSELNNSRVSSSPVVVQPAYVASLTVDVHTALANTPIPMHGLATLGDTGAPAAFVPIKIHILVRGSDRTYTVLTDGTGAFTNVFYPLPNEAGNYQVAAAFPGINTPTVQDTFTLIGMSVVPVGLVSVIEGTSVTNVTRLNNLSDVPLTGLSVSVVTNQPNLAVTASLETNVLGGFGSANLRVAVTALNPSIYQSGVVLQIASAEGATATLTITVRVEALRPRLVTSPASLNSSMLRGTQTPLAFTLSNQGGVATGPLRVLLPNVPWLSLASSNQLPALPAGSNTVITLLLNPASDLPLGDYSGTLVVESTNAGLSVPYSLRAISAATGNMLVSAEDEYTYFASGSPRVTNATVVLSDALSRIPVVTNYTGLDGTILFTNLTEAYYIVDVSATNHSPFRQTALAAAGSTTNVVAFLTRQTVHYSFTVVPTTVQDSYIFTVDSTFETQVPIPVVTIEPASIDLSQYPDTEFQVLLTVRNHGLIDAEDVKLNIPSTSRLQLTPLVSDLGKLKANTSLTVPLLVKRILPPSQAAAKSGVEKQDYLSGECSVTGEMLWNYLCGPSVVDKSTAFYAFDSTGCDLVALFREVYHLVPDGGPGGGGGGSTISSDDYFDYLESLSPVTDFEAPPGYHFECNSAPGVSAGASVTGRRVARMDQAGSPVKQDNSVCAKVKLRLDQKGVLTRDAFKATLEIDNDVPSALQNVGVTLTITGENGSQVITNFAVTPAELSGLTAVDGTGTLAGNSTGVANWTLIPTLDAAPTNGFALYLVGGTLHYTQDGSDLNVPLGPTPIQVFPQPELVVKYFHDRDVFSDDPFTPEIEPSIPYSLAVQVNNVGYGAAQALSITSGKPQVLDNIKGLSIDFTILGAQLESQSITPALDVNFGQIASGTNKIARWLFSSSIQGSFTNFSASFKQVDQFGKPRLSLIRSVEIHELTHIVDGNGPRADGRPDFLVNDLPDPDFVPDTIYLSDGSTNLVAAVSNIEVTGTLGDSNLSVVATAAAPAGWSYFRFQNPGAAQYRLTRVLRNDNSEVPFGTNVWTTDRFIRGGSLVPIRTNLVHLLDYNSAGSYTLFYVPVANTNDTVAPTSLVAALPAASPPNFSVQWSGADNPGGSGVSLYDVFVSINGGPFAPWFTNTTLTAAIYTGVTNNQYAFYSRATDAAGNREAAHSAADTQTTVSAPGNTPPSIAVIPRQFVGEGSLFSLFPNATDSDLPSQSLTWSLLPGAPAGTLFSVVNGHITWQTGPADRGTTNTFTITVTDSGSPNLSATLSFDVVVIYTNHLPVIVPPPPQMVVNEESTLTLQLTANDPDTSDVLTWEWASAIPTGLNFNPATGLLTWTPTEAQGPGSYLAKVIVRDNGTPSLSDTNTFVIQVNESNRPPALSAFPVQNAQVLEPFSLAYTATDPDVPTNSLQFSLGTGAPTNAYINPTTGLFVWPPARTRAGTTNAITVVVTDDGVPPLSSSNTLLVVVGHYAEAILGSAVVEAGQSGSVPLTIAASAPVTNVTFTLDIPASSLTNVSIASPVPPLAAATVQQIAPGRLQITLQTLTGQTISGIQTVSSLGFDALPGAPSAFLHLQISGLSVKQSNGTALSRTLSTDGQVTLVNVRPLLVAEMASDGTRNLTLLGTPGLSYQLQYSSNLSSAGDWRDWIRVPMTNSSREIKAFDAGTPGIFYRAYEFEADPPILDAGLTGNQTGMLTLYGRPGVTYQIQFRTNLLGAAPWSQLQSYTPTNSFYFLNNLSVTNPFTFYRILKP